MPAALLIAGLGLAADPLPRTELAKRGKAATALVLTEPRGVAGAAFVVHPDGLLVTCRHVVETAASGPVRVALRPGGPDEKVLDARVVRTGQEHALALLRVDGEKGLPALPLGDSDRLTELAELVAFGFPFPGGVPPAKPERPPVTVAIGTVSSLRRNGRDLAEVRLNGDVGGQGYAGGPLLAGDGTAAGVVLNSPGQPTAAIPANLVKRFLAAPEVAVTPPKLDPGGLDKPAEFRAAVTFLLPPAGPPAVELVLDTGDGRPRTVPMEGKDGAYRASAVPVPRADPVLVGMAARFGPVAVSGPVADREFTVGGKPLRLSRVRRLEPGKAVGGDGATVAGPLAGLDGVELTAAGAPVRLDLAKADAVDLTPPADPTALTCTAVVRVGGKEVGRGVALVGLPGAGRAAGAGRPAPPPVTPAKLEADRVARKLPEPFADVCAGGGGRYLLFHLPKAGKIALFDVSAARIVHYFPAPDPAAKFAAGADALVIGLPAQGILQRWSLTTFERELSVPAPSSEPLASVLLGHGSAGPVVANGHYLDLRTLKPIAVEGNGPGARHSAPRSIVSADGTVIGSWNVGVSPTGLNTTVLTGTTVRRYNEHLSPGYVAPSPDGQRVYTLNQIYTTDLKPLPRPDGGLYFLPAVHGSLYAGVRVFQADPSRQGDLMTEAAAYLPGDTRPLVPIGRWNGDRLHVHGGDDPVGVWKRFWLNPDAQVVVTLPTGNAEVELTRFDLDAALEKAGTDYLFVPADPPATARKGERYDYRLVVKSKRGGVRCKLDAGPAGMTVAADGRIDWAVPADFPDKSVPVIVSVADASGQEVFKTFTLAVEG